MSPFRRTLPALVAAGAALAAAACSSAPTADHSGGTVVPTLEALPRPLTAAEHGAVTASGGFSLSLFREVNRRKAGENVFVSPISAEVALAMTAQGSAGATETAMRGTLGFADQSLDAMGDAYRGLFDLLVKLDPTVTLTSANAIWYRRGLPVLPSFVSATQQKFGAAVSAADFSDVPGTLAQINGWAKAKTNGKIDKVLDAIDDQQVMFLLNALYFKGSWREKFDTKLTADAPFTASDGHVSNVPLMHREGTIAWARGSGFQAVDLPYGNAAFSMTVLLPDQGRSADALATSLDPAAWSQLLASLHDAPVQLWLPRFTFSYADEWKDVLTTLGMGIAFGDLADFSRMVQDGGVTLDFVKQNAFVDVNEEGTEAAAVTTVGVTLTSMPVFQQVRVDRPFVFVIRERLTGAILFLGKVDQL
jgi:serine protease inhibitor